MAQTGFTPIITYHSTTGSAVPSNSNLSPGELALNIADMKLYCENSSGTVTLLASGDAAAGNFTTVDTTNIEVTNIKAKDGTSAGSIADATGVVTLASSVLTTTDINAGTIDNTAIGGSTPAAGSFTTLNTSGQVVFNDAGADVDFRVEGDTDANLLFVDASADAVGIGTNTPSSILHVSQTAPLISATSTNNSSGLRFNVEGTATTTYRFQYGGNTQATIDSSGNVGIGVTSVSSSLSGDARVLGICDPATTNLASLRLGSSSTFASGTKMEVFSSGGSCGLYGENNVPMTFSTNATERMRITSDGYLKASDNGTYQNATDQFYEFYQTANKLVLYATATNASYSSEGVRVLVNRAANSAYSFYTAYSDVGNDVEFKLRGDGNGYADGTWNNNGADYAEYFESVNGQALTLGATVVLDGNKVREATDQDPASSVIGVVRPKEPSKASMVVGNTAWNKWANKYLTDDFDRYIMEDHEVVEWEEQVLEREAVEAVEAVVDEEGIEVSPAVPAQEAVYKTVQHSYESHNIPEGITVPEDATRKTHDDKGNKFQHYQLNPEWNPDSEYVNRENRPEWNIIGLLGQVKILKGQPVGDRWIKMRDVSETVEEWMIR